MLAASYVISSPLSVPTTTKKKFYLNLNQYRNAHHYTLAKAKVNFEEIMTPRVKHLPQFDTVHLIFTLFPGTEQLVDTSNVCSIVDKFFSDVLVKCNKLKDDNRKIVLSVAYRYGEVDRLNPRVEVTIIPGEFASAETVTTDQPKRDRPMQITITQVEIEQAIEARIRSQIMVREGFRIDIDLKATRGPEGYQAVIDIVEEDAPATGSRATADEAPVETKTRFVVPKPAPKSERPTAVTKPSKPAKAEKVEKVALERAEPEPEPEAEAETEATVEAEAETEAETASEEVVEEKGKALFETMKEAAQADTAEPQAPRPSLFGNLGTPSNS